MNAPGLRFVLTLALALPFALPREGARAADDATAQAGTMKAETRGVAGLVTAEFDTLLYGEIIVHLPDDMRPGDIISGTVVAEPSGTTDEERERNSDTLEGYVVEVAGTRVTAGGGPFQFHIPTGAPLMPGRTTQSISVTLIDAKGSELAHADAPLQDTNAPASLIKQLPVAEHATSPTGFHFPPLGQQGRAVEIFGPFDGSFANTRLGARDSAPVKLLAESPRKLVFEGPQNFVGMNQLTLKEGDKEASAPYRNLGVRLSAPKTNLLRGERTTLTVEVRGLEGITQSVPLQLDARGVIQMDGGNFQNLRINPSDVRPGGVFTTTRAITGQQAGAFTCTATVIRTPYDVCLRDDSAPARVISWNTFNGDYRVGGFIGAFSNSAAGKNPSRVQMKGCIITLTHNAPDRRVFARLDTCTNSGEASVETSAPDKTQFRITDRNTSDNVCPSSR